MIAVDTNLLVYAHRQDADEHAAAADVIRRLAEGRVRWALPWPCIHEFLAIVTHARIFDPPTPLAKALDQVSAWLESPFATTLAESPGYWERLQAQAGSSRSAGPRIHDARIAALCLHHGVTELWTADRDFARFPDLRVRNPLA